MEQVIPVAGEWGAETGGPWGAAAGAYDRGALGADWPVRSGGGLATLFQEMEDKDAHLFAALQTRKNALAGCGWKVAPASDTERGRTVAREVEALLAAVPDLPAAVFALLDALAKGYAVAEVMWRRDGRTGRVGVESVRPRWPGRFALDAQGAWWLTDSPPGTGSREVAGRRRGPDVPAGTALLPRPGEAMVWAPRPLRLPARKFLSFTFQPGAASPYGTPLCAKAFWYWWFKRGNLAAWSLFNDKFGSPTAVVRYKAGTPAEDLERLTAMVEGLRTDAGVVLPEGVALEFLEARRAGAGSTYRELADWCNDEISKVVLGQTLTSGEGRRSGSLALGQVHDRVRHEYLAADARALAAALNAQLVRWLVDFNFGVSEPAPRLAFEADDPAAFRDELALDQELVRMGVALPARYFHEKYRRPAPAPGERALHFDDANLYQYHLQYGVLTVNEVRAELGLAPVAWGDVPTRAPQGGAAVPAREGDAGAVAEGREEADEARRDGRRK